MFTISTIFHGLLVLVPGPPLPATAAWVAGQRLPTRRDQKLPSFPSFSRHSSVVFPSFRCLPSFPRRFPSFFRRSAFSRRFHVVFRRFPSFFRCSAPCFGGLGAPAENFRLSRRFSVVVPSLPVVTTGKTFSVDCPSATGIPYAKDPPGKFAKK